MSIHRPFILGAASCGTCQREVWCDLMEFADCGCIPDVGMVFYINACRKMAILVFTLGRIGHHIPFVGLPAHVSRHRRCLHLLFALGIGLESSQFFYKNHESFQFHYIFCALFFSGMRDILHCSIYLRLIDSITHFFHS